MLVFRLVGAQIIQRSDVNNGHAMIRDPDFKADLARYPTRPFLREQSIWAVCVYRFGRRVLKRKPGVLKAIQLKYYWLVFRVVETLTGISIPLDAHQTGLRIYHSVTSSFIQTP